MMDGRRLGERKTRYGVINHSISLDSLTSVSSQRSCSLVEEKMKLLTVLPLYLSALAFVLLFPLASACNGGRRCVDSAAMFVFGDSLLDAGTNNFIPNSNTTVNANSPPVKANFPPYGETFFHFPTGRFTNGRNVIDFIAGHLSFGMVSPPPYLEPEAEFINGVNFASAASGILDSTGKEKNVIPLSLQIRQFLNYSRCLGKKLGGDIKAKSYLSRSMYVIGTGGNDIGLNYLANSTFQRATSVPDFVELLLSKYNEYLVTLYKNGARNFLVLDMGPLGCSPGVRLAGMKDWKGGCMETVNELAVALYAFFSCLFFIASCAQLLLWFPFAVDRDRGSTVLWSWVFC